MAIKPPPRQRDRIEEIMMAKLAKIALGDKVTPEVSGPQNVPPFISPQGQPVVGWQITLWLAHNVLIGQDPIGVSVPVHGIDLPDTVVEQVTQQLLEEARKLRSQENQPAATPDADQMLAMIRQNSQNGSG